MSASAAAPATERTLLDRFLAAIPFAVAALAVLSLLLWEAAARKTPTIFGDELEWSQLSRAIAATGHAARRGDPTPFKSLYAYFIAPWWWIHSTSAAYSAIKYVDTLAMSLAAVPTYLLARTMTSRRLAALAALASLCTSAMYYAGFLIPETIAYPWFALCAWVSVRALAGGGRRWIAAAVVVDLVAIEVRSQLATVSAAFVLAAVVLWVTGPRGQRLRRSWGVWDHIGAALLLLGLLIVANRLASPHAQQWAFVTQHWQGRMWSLGMGAASALALGLGVLPVIGGLGSLWLPERRGDPHWRAFAAYLGASIVTIWLYTAVKAAFLSTNFATRIEERNLIYLGPLLLVGAVLYFSARRPWLPGALIATGFTTWLVLYYGYQLEYPYFEAPGYGIAAMANRDWHWTPHDIRLALAVASGVALLIVLAHRFFGARAWAKALLLLAAATSVTWMLTAEIASSNGSATASRQYLQGVPTPPDWIDVATRGGGTTFLGEHVTGGQTLRVNLLEFWNRSVKHIWTLDGTSPPPGHGLTPDLLNRNGELSNDPGLPYVVATTGIDLVGDLVTSAANYTVKRVAHPWRFRQAVYGVDDDGWISADSATTPAEGTFAYFDHAAGPGVVAADIGRAGFCITSAPNTHVLVTVGPLGLDQQRAAIVARRTHVASFLLKNCTVHHVAFTATPPVALHVRVWPTVQPSDYGSPDSRHLGAQVSFSFTPKR